MIHKHNYEEFIWIDLESPRPEEIRQVAREYQIDSNVADELLLPSIRPRVDVHDGYLYLTLHFPIRKHVHKSEEQEVDFIIGKKFLITVRYEHIETFHKFEKVFDINAEMEDDHISGTGDAMTIFLLLTKRLYRDVEYEIDQIRDNLEDIEEDIFEGHEKEMVESLSRVARDILNFKQALDPHQDILKSLATVAPEFAGDQYKHRLRTLGDTYYRALKHVTRLWQTLSELRETNNSLLSTKQNEVMKIFTILAFVTFPLSLIASIFGMNTKHTPLLGTAYDFWIVMILMGFATMLMYIYFKRKGWL